MRFDRVLSSFADFFQREQLRYALVGGLAVHAWGRSRPTRDADFAVDGSEAARIVAFTGSLGFETRYRSDAFSNHEHPDPEWGHVDFMFLRGATADEIFGAVVEREVVPGRSLPVASPEHLAMMKGLAMKNFPHRALYEAEDVRVLLSVPGIDRAAVRAYYSKHGLVELFDAVTRAE